MHNHYAFTFSISTLDGIREHGVNITRIKWLFILVICFMLFYYFYFPFAESLSDDGQTIIGIYGFIIFLWR